MCQTAACRSETEPVLSSRLYRKQERKNQFCLTKSARGRCRRVQQAHSYHSASSGPPGSSSESQFNKSSSVRTERSGSPGSWLSSLKFCDRIFHTGLRFLYPVFFSLISSGFLSNMAPEYFLKKIYKN